MKQGDKPVRKNKRKVGNNKKRYISRWNLLIAGYSFLLAIGITLISDILLKDSNLLLSFLTLIAIVVIGTIADILAVSIMAAASEKGPFNAMASRKMYGARQAIFILKHAGKYSTFFADVIGDILGYLSGFAGAVVVARIVIMDNWLSTHDRIIAVIVAAMTSALIVGSKSIGKNIALLHRIRIVMLIGIVITFLKNPLSLRQLQVKK